MTDPAPATARSTHGHVVLRWLAAAPMSAAELAARVATELGDAPRFHTCDCADLDLDALLSLLATRGKIAADGARWRAEMTQVCAHPD